MDVVVIVLVIGALLVLILKKFSSFIYYVSIVDIFLRLLHFFGNNIYISELANLVNKYFPNGVLGIINNYSSGIFAIVLTWLLFANYVMFEYYVIRTFLKKK